MIAYSKICVVIFAISLIYGVYLWFKQYKKTPYNQGQRILIGAFFLLSFSAILLAKGLDFSQDLLTNEKILDRYSKIGPYGDLIGGIVNPIIAFIGIIAASLAFYAQYRANQLVQEQFSIQKFESQFYEMLQIHRDNLNEMQIEGYEFEYDKDEKISQNVVANSKEKKITSGKKVFVVLVNEFEAIYLICRKVFSHYHNDEVLERFDSKQLIFDHSYYVFFNGLGLYEKNKQRYLDKNESGLLNENLIDNYIKELKEKRDEHEKGTKKIADYLLTGVIRNPLSKTLWLSFNYKPFSGHQSLLAHYYRHLIQTVKFVVKQDVQFISYEEKRDYLRILRATLSNHEQILLYYNWLAGFGTSWETKLEDIHKGQEYNLSKNRFFTDYRMIHNIPHDLVVDEFKPIVIFDEKYQYFQCEKNREKTDSLFEIGDKIVSKKYRFETR